MPVPSFNNNGDSLLVYGVVGMEEFNGREVIIKNKTGTTFEACLAPSEDDYTGTTNINSTSFGTYVSGGSIASIYEIAHTYAEADLDGIQFAQSDDVLYMVHPNYPVRKLVRTSDNDWTMWDSILFVDGPYENTITATYTYTLSTHTIVVTSIGYNLFASTDVGRLIRWLDGSTWKWAVITHYVNGLSVRCTSGFFSAGSITNNDLADGATTSSARLGVWSATTGYPSTVTFHQDRLVFGGAALTPSRFDGSNASDYENFTPTDGAGSVTAANAYNFTLASHDFNQIAWSTSDERGLLFGTSNAEWVVSGSDQGSALTALSVSAQRTSSVGGRSIQAVQLGKSTLFAEAGALKIRELQPIFNNNGLGFMANDMTEFAEHITNPGIIQMAIQKTPQPIVWAVRSDGILLSMTYQRTLEALSVGWARHQLGGSVSGGGNAVVESVCCIPASDGSTTQVYLTVKRYINGHTLRYIEYITPFFKTTDTITSAVFSDSSLSYSGASTTTISGLNHLNGQSLSVLADGQVQANVTPTNGRVTISPAASYVTFGLAYKSQGKKLRADGGAADGTSIGKTRIINRVGFNLLNTYSLNIGPDFSSLDTCNLDSTTAGVPGAQPAMFTGITTQLLSMAHDFDNMFCWEQNDPAPGTICGIYPSMVAEDR